MGRRKKKTPKTHCEICKWDEYPDILERHHIVERTEIGTSNHDYNLCIICPTCHSKIHTGRLKIYGIYPSTEPPHGRTAIYELDGICNIPELKEAYYKPKPKQMKVYLDEEDT